MLPVTVVAHLNIHNDVIVGLLAGGIRPVGRPLPFETAKAPLGDGVIQTLPLPTPTADEAMGRPQGLRPVAGLVTAAIRMMQEAGGGLPPAQGHP